MSQKIFIVIAVRYNSNLTFEYSLFRNAVSFTAQKKDSVLLQRSTDVQRKATGDTGADDLPTVTVEK